MSDFNDDFGAAEMTELADVERKARRETSLVGHSTEAPPAVGICPVHGSEFYVPLDYPFWRPFYPCPVAGCDRLLTLYAPAVQIQNHGRSDG